MAWFDGIEEQQMPSNPIVFLKEKVEKKNRTVSIQLQSNLLIFIVKHESEIQTKTIKENQIYIKTNKKTKTPISKINIINSPFNTAQNNKES